MADDIQKVQHSILEGYANESLALIAKMGNIETRYVEIVNKFACGDSISSYKGQAGELITKYFTKLNEHLNNITIYLGYAYLYITLCNNSTTEADKMLEEIATYPEDLEVNK